MRKATGIIGSLAFICFSLLVFLSASASDNFDLSFNLTEGGFRLEFDQSRLYRGLNLEVNSNVSTRYEVIQKIIKPLENNQNPGIVIRDNFVVYALRGSNKFGNLRFMSNEHPVRSDDVIYVSAPTGEADTFSLVYGIKNIENIEPGYYSGRIGFILNPIGSNRQQVTKILDVMVNINPSAKSTIEIITPGGARQVVLNSKKDGVQKAEVLIRIKGVYKEPFSISQSLSQSLESAEGSRLNDGTVNFMIQNAQKGVSINRFTPLTLQPQDIYTSSAPGVYDNEFVLLYQLGDISSQKAGKYLGRVQFILEERTAQKKIDTLQIEVNNERMFDFTVAPENQKYAIEFSNLTPLTPPKQNAVIFETRTNIGKPYQVIQGITSALTNKQGDIIPDRYFTFWTESLSTKGTLKFPKRQEVRSGNVVLFASDNQGSSDKFKIIYELECPKDAKAGDYSTNVTYSLSEI